MVNLFRPKTLNSLFTLAHLRCQPSTPSLFRQTHCPGNKRTQSKEICEGRDIKPIFDCQCKVALVTGGSDGIGLAIAHEILSDQARHVALVGINNCQGKQAVDMLNCTYGKGKAIFINCDVQSKVQVTLSYDRLIKEFGRLDVVVNSAGIFDGSQWNKEISTNLVGTIHSMLQAYKSMSKNECGGGGGIILNISGIYGLQPLYPAPTLSAAQHGIIGLSRSFGDVRTFAKTGVRIVTLCPGVTNTKFVEDAEKRALNEMFGTHLDGYLTKATRQKTGVCGKAALHCIKNAETGSVWVVEGSKMYAVTIPDWKTYRVLKSQFL